MRLTATTWHIVVRLSETQEYVATCMNEAVAIADKLMTLSIIESTTDIDQERFKPCHDHFYVLRVRKCSPGNCLNFVSVALVAVDGCSCGYGHGHSLTTLTDAVAVVVVAAFPSLTTFLRNGFLNVWFR